MKGVVDKLCNIILHIINFIAKFEYLNYSNMEEPIKNQQELKELNENDSAWEENHDKIVACIRQLNSFSGRPTISRIARDTGLTRATIYKHLNEFQTHQVFKGSTKVHRLMMSELMTHLCGSALCGDVKAARLYFEVMGVIKTGKNVNTNILNQNSNAITVNGNVFTEEMVHNLSPENLSELEKFVKAATMSQGKTK
jgi:predicted transcriptional regulator